MRILILKIYSVFIPVPGFYSELPRALLNPIAKGNWKPMDATKFGYDVAYARPPMSNVTLDLGQIDTSLSVM